MKTAPHIAVGLTACAALAAGYVLATEDRALFDAGQTQFLLQLADTQRPQAATDAGASRGRSSFRREVVFSAPQSASPAAQAFRH